LKTGSIVNAGLTFPSGLPKCEANTNCLGLFFIIYSIEGKEDLILKSLEILPFLMGTFKSAL